MSTDRRSFMKNACLAGLCACGAEAAARTVADADAQAKGKSWTRTDLPAHQRRIRGNREGNRGHPLFGCFISPKQVLHSLNKVGVQDTPC
jgi:hypothetical protein